MNKNQFTTAALALGWKRDAYGHLKATHPTTGRLYRIKLQKLAWRLEVQSEVPATAYSPANKFWTKIRSGYYTGTDQAKVDYTARVSGLAPVVVESTADVVEKPDNGFLEQVLRKSLPTGPEPAPPMPAGMFPSWHPAHRGTPQE